MREDGGSKTEKHGQMEHGGDRIKDRLCLFVLLKNNDGGVYATYLKRMKGFRLFDE